MKEYDTYLFDADGTLLDTRELIYQSFLEMGRAMDVRLPERAAIEAIIGLPLATQVQDLVGHGRPRADYDRAIAAYREHMGRIYPTHLAAFPGAAEALAVLAGMNKKLAVVSSRGRKSLVKFLDVLGLGGYFQLVVTPEDTDRHKPDPDPALLAMERLGAKPDGTVFVGDAEFDIRCGKAAGTDAAFVVWGGMDPRDWPVQPDFVANTFADLLP